MSMYRSWLGERGDGLCACGQLATTEVQVGWHNADRTTRAGGQYDEICEDCFEADYPPPALWDQRGYGTESSPL